MGSFQEVELDWASWFSHVLCWNQFFFVAAGLPRDQIESDKAFYNLVSEVTQYHLYHTTLLVTQTSSDVALLLN